MTTFDEKTWYEVRTTLDENGIDSTLERFDTLAKAKKFAEDETAKWENIDKLVVCTNKYGYDDRMPLMTYSGPVIGWAIPDFYAERLGIDIES